MYTRHHSRELRQREIIDAARKIISKHGTKHVTVRRIAKEVGISEAAIYRHFKSKRSIFTLLVDHISDNLLGDIEKTGAAAHTMLDRIDMTMRNHCSAIEQRRGVSFMVMAEIITLGDRRLNKQISLLIDRYIDNIKNLLRQAKHAGEINPDVDVDAAAMTLFGMIHGLVNVWAFNNCSFDLVKQYEALWGFFLTALSGSPRANLRPSDSPG